MAKTQSTSKAVLLKKASAQISPETIQRYLTCPLDELHLAYGVARQSFRDAYADALEALILYRAI